MIRKKCRNELGTFNVMQQKIILAVGFNPPEHLLSQTELARAIKEPITTINYNVTRLRDAGFLNKKFKFLELTDKGVKLLTKINRSVYYSVKGLRAHKITLVFNLLRAPHNFEELRNGVYGITNGRWKGFKVGLLGCVVMFYSCKKAVAVVPDVFARTPEEAQATAVAELVMPLKEALEKMYDGLVIDSHYIADLRIGHVAWMNHPLAELYKKYNRGYKSDKLVVDHSHGVPELETVDERTASEDMEKIIDYEKAIRGSKDSKDEGNEVSADSE